MADANNHITYSLADIQRYLQGGMSAKEMHDLERAALEDPFLADALEGYSEADLQQSQQHLAQIETAILQQKEERKVIALPPLKKYRNWRVAASIILLIGIVGITYFVFNKKSSEAPLAKTESSRSAISTTDSAQMRVQTVNPPTTDTNTIAKKERVGNEEGTTLLADNKRKHKEALQEPTAEAPVPVAAMKENSGKAGLSASSALVKRDSANEIARTIIGNQQQPARTEIKPFISDQLVITASPLKKDSNKVKLSADSTSAMRKLKNGITGTVFDSQGEPVAGASVVIKGTRIGTITDENGNFSIPTNDSNVVANISAINYATKEQLLRRSNNKIKLDESSSGLNEAVVVTALGVSRTVDTTATPQGGWKSFRKYLYNQLGVQYDSTDLPDNWYGNGDLRFEFYINRKGKPVDVKVLHAPDPEMAKKAVIAIKLGPKWLSKEKNSKKRVIVVL